MPGAIPAVDPEDLIQPGDVLEVVVRRGAGEEKYAATVRANGLISVAFTDIDVKGLTEAEAEERINKKLSVVIRNPSVQVRLVQKGITRPKNFFIVGEVKSAGKYPLGRRTTLLQAISQANGYTDIASLEKVVIISRRGEASLIRVANLHQALQSGDMTADLTLEDSDVVFVPRSRMGDWFTYYNKTLLPILNSANIGAGVAFIGKSLQVLFATPEPAPNIAITCWVASVLYGEHAWQTQLLRWYITGPFSEHWHGRLFTDLYRRYGRQAAEILRQHPSLQSIVKPLFDHLLQRAIETVDRGTAPPSLLRQPVPAKIQEPG
jgi:polysaccharide export outer membrane protein